MTWETFYLGTFIVGLLLSVLFFLAGALRLPHLHVHGNVHHAGFPKMKAGSSIAESHALQPREDEEASHPHVAAGHHREQPGCDNLRARRQGDQLWPGHGGDGAHRVRRLQQGLTYRRIAAIRRFCRQGACKEAMIHL